MRKLLNHFSRLFVIARHLSSELTYHSKPQRFTKPDMRIRLLPALSDNYMYLLIDEQSKQCAAVDPVEPDKIAAAVKEEGVTLSAVFTTHHHWDHAGGNEKIAELYPGVLVYGGDERIGALTNKVKHDEKFKLGSLSIHCLFTPCHTTGHICYYVKGEESKEPVVFTGDTLFVAGCGRFFEGTPEQMLHALVNTLAKLPKSTQVYCGHEYTVANLKFAATVEPDNQALKDKLLWAQTQRKNQEPTIPSTIGEELSFNPFMRVTESTVAAHTKKSDPNEVMKVVRNLKDNFKA